MRIAVWLLDIKLTPPEQGPSVLQRLFLALCGKADSRHRVYVAAGLTLVNDLLSGISIGRQSTGLLKNAVEAVYFTFSFVLILVALNVNERFLARTFGLRAIVASAAAVAMAVFAGIVAIVLWSNITFTRALSSPNLGAVAFRLAIVPAVTVSIWTWLPAVSGFLLKAARRFDKGREWFASTADIEKKPLQSIGLVAGAIVAVCYWSVAFVCRML